MLPRHVLDELDEAFLAERWREAVIEPPLAAPPGAGRRRTGRAILPGGLRRLRPRRRGGAGPGRGPADALGQGVAAVTDLLVEPRWGRRGHGSRLLAAARRPVARGRLQPAVAWAFDADAATRKFLTSAGWEPDGATRALDVDDLLVPQLRLHVGVPAEKVPADE